MCLDYKTGFGGKFGVQDDRQDKSAVGWDYAEKSQKHESQKGEILTIKNSRMIEMDFKCQLGVENISALSITTILIFNLFKILFKNHYCLF